MQTVLMAVAIVKRGDKILLRKMDPQRSPYSELWALFGGRIEGDGSVEESLNSELEVRWSFSAQIDEKLWWDEEVKTDHDGEQKRFIYIDAICSVSGGSPEPGSNEELEWVDVSELKKYDINPPSKIVLGRLGWV